MKRRDFLPPKKCRNLIAEEAERVWNDKSLPTKGVLR